MDVVTTALGQGAAKAGGTAIAKGVVESERGSRFLSFANGGPLIFVWGASGVGKSMLIDHLLDRPIRAPYTRTTDAQVKRLKQPGFGRVRVGDVPGQAKLREIAFEEFANRRKEIAGVLFVVANGLLVPRPPVPGLGDPDIDRPWSYPNEYVGQDGVPLADYRTACLKEEMDAFRDFVRLFRQCPRLRFVRIAMNKAELWWESRAEVERYYSTEGWLNLLEEVPGVLRSWHSVSAVDWHLLPRPPAGALPSPNLSPTGLGQIRTDLRDELLRSLTPSKGGAR